MNKNLLNISKMNSVALDWAASQYYGWHSFGHSNRCIEFVVMMLSVYDNLDLITLFIFQKMH